MEEFNGASAAEFFRQKADALSRHFMTGTESKPGNADLKNLFESKSLLEMAVSLDPKEALLRAYLGRVNYHLAHDEAALHFLKKALALEDRMPGFYETMIDIHVRNSRPEEAFTCDEKAVEVHPYTSGLWKRHAACAMNTGRFETAVKSCKQALGTAALSDHGNSSAYKNEIIEMLNDAERKIKNRAIECNCT